MRTRDDSTSVRRVLATCSILLAAGLAVSPQSAEAQAGPTTYHACYVPGSGTVYRIREPGTPTTCKKSTHVEFRWIDFPRAVDQTLYHREQVITPGGSGFAFTVQCPIGTVVMSGGYYLEGTGLTLIGNAPSESNLRDWIITVRNDGTIPNKAHGWVRCVRI